jgi:hypothetical protein
LKKKSNDILFSKCLLSELIFLSAEL